MGRSNEIFVDIVEFKAKYAFKREEMGDDIDSASNFLKSELLEKAAAELKALVEKHKH
ncbi:hypothetical protein [Pedobacter sp. UYP1]|uniref:hypothetical protein n=1 Tax=Pedobacter sp. UYP1 TaxID=1756396 RepID=UPI00339AD1E0